MASSSSYRGKAMEPLIHLIRGLADLLRLHKRLRAVLVLTSPILGFLAMLVGAQFAGYEDGGGSLGRVVHQVAQPAAGFCFIVFAMCVISYSRMSLSGVSGISIELQSIRQEREELKSKLRDEQGAHPTATPASVLRTIEINLNQLTEYYTINKAQAKSSFRVSVLALIVGLITIAGGIWLYYTSPKQAISITYISTAAGVLSEFIAASYFYMYNKSISQLNFFFEKLTDTQNTMLAITLCEPLPETEATQAKLVLIRQLMKSPSPSHLEPGSISTRPAAKTAPTKTPPNRRTRLGAGNKGSQKTVPDPDTVA